MKKYIFTLLVLTIAVSVSAQCSQSQYSTDILYRGFENKVQVKGCDGAVVLVSEDCEIEQKDDHFVVKTKSSGSPVLHILSEKGDTLNSKTYQLKNLPVPTLFLSGVASGGPVNRSSGLLQVKYDNEVPLKATFQVTSWELRFANAIIKGNGMKLNAEAKSLLKAGNTGDEVTIIVTVLAEDGISRKMGGTWTLN